MRHVGKVALLVLLAQVNQVCAVATPYYRIRSQATDAAREMVGVMDKIHLYRDDCENYGIYDVTFEYTRSFQSDKLAKVLFGQGCLTSCECPSIKISGSQVANRTSRDWLADYFYLPPDFESTITLQPRVENFIIDFDAYWGLEEWCHGTYFRLHAPAVHTKWNLNFCERVNNEGVCGYDAGYFNFFATERFELLDSFTDYVSDMETARSSFSRLSSTEEIAVIGTEYNPLAYSKWAACGNTLDETRLAEIQFILGRDFFPCDDESVRYGFNLRAAMPTGNRPEGIYLFEPIVGNSHQWEFGGGFTGHWTLYDCDDARLRFYLTANITHLFADQQYRTFDLKNGCNSRYELAMALKGPGTLLYGPLESGTDNLVPLIDTTTSSYESSLEYTPVANLTRSLVDVSVDVKGDLVAMFNYVNCDWTYDLGYNFWGRSCEKIHLSDKCSHSLINNRKWVLKGDARVFGCGAEDEIQFNVLAPSQSGATIHGGADVDNAQGAYVISEDDNTQAARLSASSCVADSDFDCSLFAGSSDVAAVTSADPVFLSERDLDIEGARTRGLSHKIFAHVNYNWEPDDCGQFMFFGVGGKAEFGNNHAHSNNDCLTGCASDTNSGCTRCALSEWGIWFKGGIAY